MNWDLENGIWTSSNGSYRIEKANGGYMLCSDKRDPSPDYPNSDCWMKWFLTSSEAKSYAECNPC